ncbi:ribonuclease P protein component [Melissococcus plutonius]|uniref:Ribonuclease P protein component n=1 Tax=Melissococcus plutonius TaxID=33970 RepID=A0A2Z5Y460_9ENTE|nr:ribonuclease P protein component [Melissococcus plutonius]BAL62822.1 ribonuclease P protein component [Melissococcus plutonius DAT561]MCV2498709.1 ribonuclease P protein component [Melissococcus plutonius]MCV2501698.1 ribonuclease P protein component [Melissococcus plutonius]MCV2505011.1 ribonuclease P protein component [Melissococcus plutonius]MCV2507325.1 ribonuclease P protein component [Melissococcus plutonius]
MKKAYRVKSEKDFQKVFYTKNSCANKRFVVYSLEKPEQKHFRVGISVGKKVGNAVVRNSVKRKIRMSIYQLKEQILSEYDFIIIARPGVQNLTSEEVRINLIHILKLANILK